MQGPFTAVQYTLRVITPVYIGAAKENDYALGEDYFYDDDSGQYVFVHQRAFQKMLSNQEVTFYAAALAKNRVAEAEQILRKKAKSHPQLIWHRSYCPFLNERNKPYETIRKHITDVDGNIIIPGSSLKGALRSVIGKYLMKQTGEETFDDKRLFGGINGNFMRLLQVGDISLSTRGRCVPMKIYSGDVDGIYPYDYEGYGTWKHRRQGGHEQDFLDTGFVTLCETAPEGASGSLRINWGNKLLELIHQKAPEKKPTNADHLHQINGHQWLTLLRQHTKEYLEAEKQFFKVFPNNDFQEAIELLDELLHQNGEANSALIRLGSGSGYHAITGNWKYPDHTKTKPKRDGVALDYKTRKIAFTGNENGADTLHFPGFVKITTR